MRVVIRTRRERVPCRRVEPRRSGAARSHRRGANDPRAPPPAPNSPWFAPRWADRARSSKVRLLADGRFALSGGGGGTVRVWDVVTGRSLRVLPGHRGSVHSLAVTPDGRFRMSASGDLVRPWELHWEGEAHAPADWDDGAPPHLEGLLFRFRNGERTGPDRSCAAVPSPVPALCRCDASADAAPPPIRRDVTVGGRVGGARGGQTLTGPVLVP
ncbi:hypothetical protein [Streptomyces sp. NPDC004435]|uniref:hypothetical protein n=1 Tax=Streptomyces sp. NPDC004435 TaxID=3364701 RepID=UPI00367F5BBC